MPDENELQQANERIEELELEKSALVGSLAIAINQISGACWCCRFLSDCAKHDNNDASPPVWYQDCEDWKWDHEYPYEMEE